MEQQIYNQSQGGVVQFPFDPVAHRYWRIRYDSTLNKVGWETSPDGASWTAWKVAAPLIPIGNLSVGI